MATLASEIKLLGAAPVIVIPTSLSAGLQASTARNWATHFTAGEYSQRSNIASAMRASGEKRNAQPMRYYENLGLMYGTVDAEGYAALKKDVGKDAKIVGAPVMSVIWPTAKAAAAAPKKNVSWGIERLKAHELWKQGLTGKGVLVGHLDTGVDGKHPTLKKAIEFFAEFDDLGVEVPGAKAHDTDDHGTHTACTIAGRPVDGKHLGVAPEAGLASAIVIEGGDVIARILGGMDWALGQGARILNMSLGLRGINNQFLGLTQLLRARGVLPVFAIGNEGPGTSRSPGNYSEALSVGACNKKDEVADFSSSRRFNRPKDPIVPDLVGPGVEIVSAMPGGGFQTMDGSSMATPHIAGLAALLMQAKPTATIDQIEKAILDSCARPASMDEARANRGIPDAVKALGLL